MVDKASDKGAAGLLRPYPGKDPTGAVSQATASAGRARLPQRSPNRRRLAQQPARNASDQGYAAARTPRAVFDCKQAVQRVQLPGSPSDASEPRVFLAKPRPRENR